MTGIYFLLPTLAAIVISMLVVRAGAVALMMTGLNYEKAKFQALSAFSGTGFTTREAERVVNNADRRKIVSWLMILGNAGIVTVIVTATSSFAHAEGLEAMASILFFVIGLGVVFYAIRYLGVFRRWENFIHDRLVRHRVHEEELSTDELLHLSEGFGVLSFRIPAGSAIEGSGFSSISSLLDNASVLGLERGTEWVSRHHHPEIQMQPSDLLVVYGNMRDLKKDIRKLLD